MAYVALATDGRNTQTVHSTEYWPDMREFATQESIEKPEHDILVYGSGGLFRTFRNGRIAER